MARRIRILVATALGLALAGGAIGSASPALAQADYYVCAGLASTPAKAKGKVVAAGRTSCNSPYAGGGAYKVGRIKLTVSLQVQRGGKWKTLKRLSRSYDNVRPDRNVGPLVPSITCSKPLVKEPFRTLVKSEAFTEFFGTFTKEHTSKVTSETARLRC